MSRKNLRGQLNYSDHSRYDNAVLLLETRLVSDIDDPTVKKMPVFLFLEKRTNYLERFKVLKYKIKNDNVLA